MKTVSARATFTLQTDHVAAMKVITLKVTCSDGMAFFLLLYEYHYYVYNSASFILKVTLHTDVNKILH
jgi:hypothetical protein